MMAYMKVRVKAARRTRHYSEGSVGKAFFIYSSVSYVDIVCHLQIKIYFICLNGEMFYNLVVIPLLAAGMSGAPVANQ